MLQIIYFSGTTTEAKDVFFT